MKRLTVLVGIICVGACGPGTVDTLQVSNPGEVDGNGSPSASAGKGGADGKRATKGPPHPVVLVHGLFGFDKLLGTIEAFPASPPR